MAKNNIANPIFSHETAARGWFEAARWPNGPVCPKCGSAKAYATKKAGVYRCASPTCRKDFTVMTGSIMERSHAKLTQWPPRSISLHLARKAFPRISSTANWAVSTTRLGFLPTASAKQCAEADLNRRWAEKVRS